MHEALTVPVVLIAFNRPDSTERVFAAIKAVQPSQLFLIADGPRSDVPADKVKCATVRKIIESVDWPCDVVRRFSAENLGLRRNISEGLDWVFERVERAIILEDDCLPIPTFFPFCAELLDRYANDPHVATISGTNLDPSTTAPSDGASYYFSRFVHIWGWATWRRVWQLCDHDLQAWPELRRQGWLKRKWPRGSAENYWRRHFDDSYRRHPGGLSTWDVPLVFSCWKHDMVSIVPRTNLVANIGFGADATHTNAMTRAAEVPRFAMQFPLQHPRDRIANTSADEQIQQRFFEGITAAQRLYWKLRLPLPIWLVRSVAKRIGL